MFKMFVIVFLFLVHVSTLTMAGNSGTNAGSSGGRGKGGNTSAGGDGFETNDEILFLDLVREPDNQFLRLKGAKEIKNRLRQTFKRHVGYTKATYFPAESDRVSTSVQDKILSSFDSLEFRFVAGPIPEANDRGKVVLYENIEGATVRLALQERESRRVFVDLYYYQKMKRVEHILAFFLHETFIRMWFDDFHNEVMGTTEKIANLVHETFAPKPEPLTANEISKYLCDAGISVGPQSDFGLRFFTGSGGPNVVYPQKVVFFYMNDGRCQVLPVNLDGPAEGLHYRSGSIYFHTWKFLAADPHGMSHSLILTIYAQGQNQSPSLNVESYFPNFFIDDAQPSGRRPFEVWSK